MGIFDSMHVSASGLSAERLRMDVIAQNLANVNTTRTENGTPYRRREVVFQAVNVNGNSAKPTPSDDNMSKYGVEAVGIVEDPSPYRMVFDPSHPDADQQGYVYLPNVNTVTEMIDMTTAQRAYEANVTALNSAKNMALKALDILR